jgi:hypothetical protein
MTMTCSRYQSRFLAAAQRHAPLVLLASLTLACTPRVPKEAVELSTAVGEGIVAMQTRHEAMVRAYFDLSRQRVEDFLQHRWVPEFLQSFVQESEVIELLDRPEPFTPEEEQRLAQELTRSLALRGNELQSTLAAVRRGLGDADRGLIMLDFANAAIEQIELQRDELMVPIARQERQVVDALRGNYADLVQMQSTVTAHIQSVRDVVVEQEAVLRRLGLLQARDQLIADAVALNDKMVGLTDKAESAAEIREELRELLRDNR